MKVALVSEWLDGWRGGAETSTSQFVDHLLAMGVELHVFTRSRPSPTPQMHVHTVSGASMSRTRQSVTFAHRVDRMIRENSFDIVHAISPCLSADIYQPRGGTIAETIERNIALRNHATTRSIKRYLNHFNFKQRFNLAMERKLLGSETGPIVVAISDYVVDQLKRHYELPDRRIRLVFNGVNPDQTPVEDRARARQAIRSDYGIGDDQLLVLLVAHNFRLKGVHRWMETLAQMVQNGASDIRSLVVGKGDSARWHRLAARLHLGDVLRFTGPSERVTHFLHASDVLVHPTYYDPCSRVVLEAIMSELPVITTKWDGAGEAIEHGECGFLLQEPVNRDELAGYINTLRTRSIRESMSAKCESRWEQISMSRHTRELAKVYEELLARK